MAKTDNKADNREASRGADFYFDNNKNNKKKKKKRA
jgi:hypothetical protein